MILFSVLAALTPFLAAARSLGLAAALFSACLTLSMSDMVVTP
jgi:hypothetical protein